MSHKILIYTVSDFKEKAVECIEMLFESFLENDEPNVDLAIISNTKNKPYKKINKKIHVIYDDDPHSEEFVGFLKFSDKIPDGYDYYIYLDSDILFYGKSTDLYKMNYDFSMVREHWVRMNNPWFCYKYAPQEDLLKMETLDGINSGTFGFKQLSFLKKVRDLYVKHITEKNVMKNIMLEQSSFNYALCKELDFNFEKVLDLTDKTLLFAQKGDVQKEKIIYHFNGFLNQMMSKYTMMKEFSSKIKK